jgi:hypothetical protein
MTRYSFAGAFLFIKFKNFILKLKIKAAKIAAYLVSFQHLTLNIMQLRFVLIALSYIFYYAAQLLLDP